MRTTNSRLVCCHTSAAKYASDRCWVHGEHFSQAPFPPAFRMETSNGQNVLVCELASGVPLPSRSATTPQRTRTMSPLVSHVAHVVAVRSQKEMRRVHASRIVACVANANAVVATIVRYGPKNHLVNSAMRKDPIFVLSDQSVPCGLKRPIPQPAPSGGIFAKPWRRAIGHECLQPNNNHPGCVCALRTQPRAQPQCVASSFGPTRYGRARIGASSGPRQYGSTQITLRPERDTPITCRL